MFKKHSWVITKYITTEFLLSFFVAFLFFFVIFFINQLLLMAEDILAKHVPFWDVLLLIMYSLPAILAISFPFASLVGTLMAMGRFSSSNEIIAFRACGISTKKIFTPIFVVGLLLSTASFYMNDYFLPLGTIEFGKHYRKLLYSNPELELESYAIKYYQDSILITGEVEGNQINGLTIIDKTQDKNQRVISAQKAFLKEDYAMQGIVSLILNNVISHTTDNKNEDRFEYSFAETMQYNILLRNLTFSIQNPGPREMRAKDVRKEIVEKEKQQQEKIRQKKMEIRQLNINYYQNYLASLHEIVYRDAAREKEQDRLNPILQSLHNQKEKVIRSRSLQINKLEYYKKYAIPFACLVFVIFAFPIGIHRKKAGKSVGFGIGLFVSVVYWAMLVAGQSIGVRTFFSPFLAIWFPNFLILTIGLIFNLIRVRK